VIAALKRTRTLTRGPKPVRALKEIGLSPSRISEAPTTEGVIASLHHETIHGQTVGVQLYSESNPPLLQSLHDAGATARTVLPYVYAPAADAARVCDLIDRLSRGEVDVVLFTSSPQVDRLFEVANEQGRQQSLTEGLAKTRIAAVGPIVAESLRQCGARIDICPEQGFVMKNLVLQIRRSLAEGAAPA
jgi:uroporphyrinogen-III synthase